MTTRRRIRQMPLAEDKKLWEELEQQPVSFDLALALRHRIETVQQDADIANRKVDEDIERAKSRAAADFLLAAFTTLTTPIADE